VYVPAYILAPMKDRTICDLDPSVSNNGGPINGLVPSVAVRPDKFAVLYVSYCLSEDQRWLVASCTDERGELVDSCTIGIDVPNRFAVLFLRFLLKPFINNFASCTLQDKTEASFCAPFRPPATHGLYSRRHINWRSPLETGHWSARSHGPRRVEK
jgi:hypothetical protein